MTSETAAVEAAALKRNYRVGGQTVRAVDGVSLTVQRGETLALMGPSGSGKSTLLYLLGGLERPDEGSVRVTGVDWETRSGNARARFRRRACRFITQGQSLLPQATAAENVELPLLLDGGDPGYRSRAALEALDMVGLAQHSAKLPDQLSGGEQQRVAIARALVGGPVVVLADEPTGNLDSATGEAVTRLLIGAAGEHNAAVVLVTHDPAVARHASRTVQLHSGRLAGQQTVDGESVP
jgi:putative ABC transport system ATP-binding protein